MSENNPTDDQLREVLVGKTIASVDKVGEGGGVITLTDGTALKLDGNEGCGGCSEGWYSLTHLAPAAGIITNVRADVVGVGDYQYEERFRIFVVAADTETMVASFDGSDNGYYGTGWWLTVEAAAA